MSMYRCAAGAWDVCLVDEASLEAFVASGVEEVCVPQEDVPADIATNILYVQYRDFPGSELYRRVTEAVAGRAHVFWWRFTLSPAVMWSTTRASATGPFSRRRPEVRARPWPTLKVRRSIRMFCDCFAPGTRSWRSHGCGMNSWRCRMKLKSINGVEIHKDRHGVWLVAGRGRAMSSRSTARPATGRRPRNGPGQPV